MVWVVKHGHIGDAFFDLDAAAFLLRELREKDSAEQPHDSSISKDTVPTASPSNTAAAEGKTQASPIDPGRLARHLISFCRTVLLGERDQKFGALLRSAGRLRRYSARWVHGMIVMTLHFIVLWGHTGDKTVPFVRSSELSIRDSRSLRMHLSKRRGGGIFCFSGLSFCSGELRHQ